jgi:hypothetical protein
MFVLSSKLRKNRRKPERMNEFHEENPKHVKDAEIVVGILPPNDTRLVTSPIERVDEGLIQFFPDRKAAIIGCNDHSGDRIQEAFLDVKTKVPKIYLSTPKEGKSNNLRNLSGKALDLGAKAIIVSADPMSITPPWIRNLGEPLFRNFGYVSPLYLRHRFEGNVTNNIAYPLTRALYGRRVRQPIGGDFGFSDHLARLCVDDTLWDERNSRFGIDIWMITLAITEGVPICQSFMGQPKMNEPKDPAADLGPAWNQVVETIFIMMGRYAERWCAIKWSKPTAIFGFGQGAMEVAPEMEVSKKKLYSRFAKGVKDTIDQWKAVLAPEVFIKLTEVAAINTDRFDFPTELWAKALFDYAIAFRSGKEKPNILLESLQPLYYGRVLSHVNKVENMSTQQAEGYVEDQCLVFEETKPYLIRRWNEA